LTLKTSPPTLHDVSIAAGFSTFTVSRALAGLPGVSDKTRKHVIATARELGYVANQPARRLKQGSSTTIGVLTANNANPFYSTLVNGFEDIVIPAGYHCIISDSTHHGEHSPTRESLFLEDLLQQRVAGVALTYQPAEQQLRRLLDWPLPVVFMDSYPPAAHRDTPFVVVDGENISYEVGRHFADHGYNDWMFLGHPESWSTREGRQRGFSSAARDHGARLEIVEGRNDPDEAAQAVLQAIRARDEPPRAIFAANEPLVIGTLRALRELGLSIPSDVALIGYDETQWAEFTNPALTVVDQSIAQIGEIAGMRLLEMITENPSDDLPSVREPVLVIRDSCGAH
jgi:LacI family transcriptional regulator